MRVDIANPNPESRPRNCAPNGKTKPDWDTKSVTAADTQRISTCGICALGVFRTQPRVWSNGIDGPIGINHEACVEARRQQGGGVVRA